MAGNRDGRIILKSDIEIAQANTKSAVHAANYLNLCYNTYKKWAMYYGIHATYRSVGYIGNKNERPVSSSMYTKMEKIMLGKCIPHPRNRYRVITYLMRLGFLDEKCALCGLHEKRLTDMKAPLMLNFRDGNEDNWLRENLEMLCFNHFFLTVGDIIKHGRRVIY